jgi:hypothetical protein
MDESTRKADRANDSRRSLGERLAPTSRAVAFAHDAHLRDSLDRVTWERRGVLGRLTRSDR